MASFGGTSFGERLQGVTFPAFPRKADFSLTRIPGGNVTIIQDSGRLADELTMEGYCTAAQEAALLAKVGTVASLVYSAGTRSAYLAELVPGEVMDSTNYFITLKFVGR